MQRSSKAFGTELLCDLIEEAERSRQRVHLQTSILEQVSNAVIVAVINGEVFYMNPYAEKLLSATFFEGYWAGEISAQKKGRNAVCRIPDQFSDKG